VEGSARTQTHFPADSRHRQLILPQHACTQAQDWKTRKLTFDGQPSQSTLLCQLVSYYVIADSNITKILNCRAWLLPRGLFKV